MNGVTLIKKLTLTIKNTLKESQTVKGEKVNFIQSNGFSHLHGLCKCRRMKHRLTIVESEILHQVGGHHRRIANDTAVRGFFESLSSLTSALSAIVYLKALIDSLSDFFDEKVSQNAIEFRTVNLMTYFLRIRTIHKVEVIEHILLRFFNTFSRQSVYEPKRGSEIELFEEVNHIVQTALQLIVHSDRCFLLLFLFLLLLLLLAVALFKEFNIRFVHF